MAFVSGLQTTSVDRLKETWKKIESKTKLWTTFQELVKLFDSEGNFQEYRTATKNISNSPAIPYLGMSVRTDSQKNILNSLFRFFFAIIDVHRRRQRKRFWQKT